MARHVNHLQRCLHLLVAIAFGGIATDAVFASESSYIFEIPAERSTTSDAPLGEYILAALNYANPARAAAGIAASGALDIVEVKDGVVIVGIRRNAVTTAPVAESDLAATFVVDFDEDPVASSANLLRDAYGAEPTPGEIEQFVFDYIDDKNYRATFDLASKVARTRSGDCTEHAVLLAALARVHGLPARLVMGVVLVIEGDDISGYGHAWTEVHHEGSWQLLDGTAPESVDDAGEAFYLPLMSLRDEGPGYGLDFMRLANVQPAGISEIRGVSP